MACGRPPTASRATETGSGGAMQREHPRTKPAMQLRVARQTARLQEVVGFYRDGIGLTQSGGFRGHDGYDGAFLAVPGTGAHLELTAGGGHGAPAPPPLFGSPAPSRPSSATPQAARGLALHLAFDRRQRRLAIRRLQ